MSRPRPDLPTLLLAPALACACALLLALEAHHTFFQDTWAFLLERRGFSAADFLRPHNEHISVIPVAINKALIGLFGMTSALPEQILLNLMLAATAALVFVYVRRRVGPWPALFAAVALLFLGPAWEALLWPFEISLVGSLLSGVAMLLALERGDRRGDLAACALLVVSIGFSSLGVAFVAGAAADVFVRRRERGLRRAWVAAVPLLLYAAWYAGYGSETESAISRHNLLHAPIFIVESIGAASGALLGARSFAGELNEADLSRLAALGLVALLALLGWLHLRHRDALYSRVRTAGISPRLWPALASGLAFWGLAALNRVPGREPTTSRYLHIGAVFVILIGADLLRGARFRTQALVAAAALLAVSVGLNMVPLIEGKERLDDEAVLTRSDLAAIDIASRTVDPYFRPDPYTAGTPSLINVSAEAYLAESAESGSPAYTQAELAAAPEMGRRQADLVLARALPITTRTRTDAALGPTGGCRKLGGREVELGPGAVLVEVGAGPPATLLLRRFAAAEYGVRFPGLLGGSTTLLRIPADRSRRPWRLRLGDDRPARVCSRRG